MLRIPSALLLVVGLCTAADPDIATVQRAFPAGDGLAVQVGAADAGFLARLTGDGRRLVHGLALADAERDRVRAGLIQGGVHPLATVATWHGGPRLPYADRLVNLLIVDRDALGAAAPPPAECLRVLALEGVLLERAGGAWSSTVAPRPQGIGDWTHFDGGANGNAVAEDTTIDGLRALQWIDNSLPVRWYKDGPHGGNDAQMLVSGRHLVIDRDDGVGSKRTQELTKRKQTAARQLECRDAGNGLLLWAKERPDSIAGRRWTMAVADGKVFTWVRTLGPLVAIDLASGKEVTTLPGGELKPWVGTNPDGSAMRRPSDNMEGMHVVRAVSGAAGAPGSVVMSGHGVLHAWTTQGKPLWSYSRPDLRIELPVIDPQSKRIYAVVAQRGTYWGRWPANTGIVSLICLDLATGRLEWENTAVASRDIGPLPVGKSDAHPAITAIGQLIVADGMVMGFNSQSHSGGKFAYAVLVDAKTGKLLQEAVRTKDGKEGRNALPIGFLYHALIRDGKAWILNTGGGMTGYSFDPASGMVDRAFRIGWNARCVRAVATRDSFITGQTAFLDREGNGTMASMARSGCNFSAVPAAGLVFFAPHLCSCVTHFDGYLAIAPRATLAPVADQARLVVAGGAATTIPPAGPLPQTLIGSAWNSYTISSEVLPEELKAGAWTLRVDPQQHRIDAVGAGRRWSYVADARIGTALAVIGERVVVGGHDGWVRGLDLASGAERWRYLVAPAHRLIIANGMLTSSWPVFGVAELGRGQVVASAGTHPELDGGVRVVALDAASGKPTWTKDLVKTQSRLGERGGKLVEFSFMNAPIAVERGQLVIDGGHHLNRFAFSPGDSAEELSRRLSDEGLQRGGR